MRKLAVDVGTLGRIETPKLAKGQLDRPVLRPANLGIVIQEGVNAIRDLRHLTSIRWRFQVKGRYRQLIETVVCHMGMRSVRIDFAETLEDVVGKGSRQESRQHEALVVATRPPLAPNSIHEDRLRTPKILFIERRNQSNPGLPNHDFGRSVRVRWLVLNALDAYAKCLRRLRRQVTPLNVVAVNEPDFVLFKKSRLPDEELHCNIFLSER